MIKLYGHELSGNSYKVKLMLSLLEIDYEWIEVDLLKGEHQTAEFLELNPFGQVPVLVDNDITLADSQAILVYLARRYGGDQWLPSEPEFLSRVVRWLSITAGEVREGVGFARLYYLFNANYVNIERATQRAEFILTQLERHLSDNRQWLECDCPTIADIAVFPYVALAEDGKISLKPYTKVLSWIDRVQSLPGFIAMPGIEISKSARV
ncbi:MAG: glutathione S-transferase family protein [Pleurocapsa sp. SU_5_0]|nr:glutathione S-transferase family protein [Pleurocapsa sp. SU_5_0]NJO94764.1 glutathione S-transferase family protein [Pleurocapsa sp. CRU_1_2]NJR46712.1 glutathione S-transferase family protein [Hyellaceae cyanobacterium CSU_1_1]